MSSAKPCPPPQRRAEKDASLWPMRIIYPRTWFHQVCQFVGIVGPWSRGLHGIMGLTVRSLC